MGKIISIVIPIYRDGGKIGRAVDELADFFNREKINGELIIVNDGGRDAGAQVVEEKIRQYPFLVKFINRSVNRGKGYSVREGLAVAKGDFIFYTDADLPYTTVPIKEMIGLLERAEADFVLVKREFIRSGDEKPSWARQITHVIYSLLVRSLIPIKFTDTLAGLKGMTAEVARIILPRLTIDRYSFDVELLLATERAGFKIKEVAALLKNVGKSNLVLVKDGPQMVKDVIRIKLNFLLGKYPHLYPAHRKDFGNKKD